MGVDVHSLFRGTGGSSQTCFSQQFLDRQDTPRVVLGFLLGKMGRDDDEGVKERWPSPLAAGLAFCPSSLAPMLPLPELSALLSPVPEFPLFPLSPPSPAHLDTGQRE